MGCMMLLAIDSQSKVLEAVKTVFPLYSFWNLNFFRSIMPDIYVNVDTLESLALDYAIAVYHIILIIISYILIELYDQNIRCIVYLWKPLYWILSFFQKIGISTHLSLTLLHLFFSSCIVKS